MVLIKKQFAFPVLDANHELIRLARAGNSYLDEESLRLLEEDDQIEEQYKVLLYYLLTTEERSNHNKKNDKDDATDHNKRSDALKKRKFKEDDDCNGAEEENDPEYELFLKHLKEHDKSYVLEYEKDGLSVVIKYEEDIASNEECGLEPEHRRKLVNEKIPEKQGPRMVTRDMKHKCGPSAQMRGAENQHKRDPHSISIKKTSNADKAENVDGLRNVKLGGFHNVYMHKDNTVINEKINDQKREDGRNFPIDMKPKSRFSENQQRISVKKTDALARGKSRNETVKEENHEDYRHFHMHKGHTMVNKNIFGVNDGKKQSGKNLDRNIKQKVELSHQMPHLETQHRLDLQPASAKNTKSLTLKTSRNEAHNARIEKCSASEFRKVMAAKHLMAYNNIEDNNNARIEKCSASEFRKVMAAKHSMAYNNIEENNLEKKGNDRCDCDVEILDEAACVKRGVSNPFVSSKRFSKSMEEDGFGRSNVYEEFREGVLNVLKKPYDREEYTRHLEAIQAGSYFDYHPDLGRKLKKYRNNRRKRLNILRGFFFWLQNLTQEGAFKPWKDRACLVVEPPSP